MKRYQTQFATSLIVIAAALASGHSTTAQYSQYPVDNGQQYWQNYWRFHNQQYAPARQYRPPAGYQQLSAYPPGQAAEKPFSHYHPAPNAFQKYGPLMVYPNSFGAYF